MRQSLRTVTVVALLALTAACAQDDDTPRLMNVEANRSGNGPDEFGVVPNKPLQIPESLTALPPPTPGGRNLADATPKSDAVEALGGRASALEGTGQLRGEPALIARVGRFGIETGIRNTLAAEDLEYRRSNEGLFFERVFNRNLYFEAYEDQSLEQYAELRRLRRLGLRTPSAPPPPEE